MRLEFNLPIQLRRTPFHFALTCQISLLGSFFNFAQVFNCFGLITWLAWIVSWYDHLNVDGHNVFIGLNKPSCFDSFAGDAHKLLPVMEMDGYEFCYSALTQMRPHGFEFRPIGQLLLYLNTWVGIGFRPL